jgi:hypothetical protein
MNQSQHNAVLKPVFVREYPPFALAMGMSFLSWLTGSIAYDSLFGKNREVSMVILFGLVFLAVAAIALYSWNSILCIRRIGLIMDENGVSYVKARLLGYRTFSLPWQSVSKINIENSVLSFFSNPETETVKVDTSSLLENPEWIKERGIAWLEAVTGRENNGGAGKKLADLQTRFEGAVCQTCGGGVEIGAAGAENAVCRFCGDNKGLSDKVRESLNLLSSIIRDLPEAHRQFQEKTLRRFMEDGGKHRRTLFWVGWGTACVWILFGAVNLVSDLAREEVKRIDYRFLGVMAGLAVLSVISSYVLAYFIRKVSGKFSLPMLALAPVEAGGSARCRLCGAELPAEGVVRRCQYCNTDSVVSGNRLAEARRKAEEAVAQAQSAVNQSTETAGRLLDNAAVKMQYFAFGQFFWLHIPILVSLDGSTGMLYKLSGIFIAMLLGNLASAVLGLKWLN